MPRPSPIDDLLPDQRKAFEQELIRRNFKDYDGLAGWLESNGFEISRSSAYRHASKIKRRLQAVKDSTEAARLIAEAAPDDADLRSAAVISMVQSELFEVMVTLQQLDEGKPEERVMLLKEAARSVLDMTKASVMQKKWQQEAEARIRREAREEAAQVATKAAKLSGLSADIVAAIRSEILGVAS